MEITLIGFILIPIVLLLLAFDSKYLFALLVFFSPFTATSVINVYSISFGLQLSLFIGAIFTLKMLFELIKNRERLLLSKMHATLISALLLFVTILMPGFIINTLNGDIRFFNFTQFIYLLSGVFISLSISMYLFLHQDQLFKSVKFFIYASVFVSTWGLYQLFTIYFGIPYLDFIFNNSISDAALKFDMELTTSRLSRISSVAVEPSFMARTNAVALAMLTFYYFFNEYIQINKKHLIALILIFSTLLFTLSSSAILGLAFIAFLVFLLKPLKSFPIIVFGVLLLLAIVLSDDSFIKSFESLTTGKVNTVSYDKRMGTILAAWNGFLDSPFFGLGWEENPSQDVFVKLLGNTGIFGTAIFIFIYFSIIYYTLKNSKRFNDSRKWLYISVSLSILTLLVIDIASSLSFIFSFMWVLLGVGMFTASYYAPKQETKF